MNTVTVLATLDETCSSGGNLKESITSVKHEQVPTPEAWVPEVEGGGLQNPKP